MGIQSFTPSAGGSPDRSFIGTVSLVTTARDWAQSGSSGYYSIMSATNQAGYVIYTDGTNKTGAPVGKSVYVGHSFNSITIMGLEADQFSLYKVAPKTTNNVSDVFSRFTLGHTTITSSANHNFPGTYLPVADLLVVGGGGGGGHNHGGGGGGGGIIYLSKFPMVAVTPANIGAVQTGNNQSQGYSTTFGGITATGGGGGGHHNHNGGGGANGGGAGGHHTRDGGGGSVITGMPYGFTYAGPYAGVYSGGNRGGNSTWTTNNNRQRGGGGGGANGQGQDASHDSNGGDGGAGYVSPFQNVGSHVSPYASTHFSAGGGGATHNPAVDGRPGTGWVQGGYGMGGNSTHNSQTASGPGVIIYRSYS